MLKNVLAGWILWQLLVLGFGLGFQALSVENKTFDCQFGLKYKGVAELVIDVTVPLSLFIDETPAGDYCRQ